MRFSAIALPVRRAGMPTVVIPLTPEGAVVEALVGVSKPREAMLQAAGDAIPPAIPVRLLVDTGATGTCVEIGLLTPLGLTPTGSGPMHTASTAGTPVVCPQYDVSIIMPTVPVACCFAATPVFECQPLAGSIQGLLGRDILDRCILTYNPHSRVVTLSL
jgi:Aspartyl protease